MSDEIVCCNFCGRPNTEVIGLMISASPTSAAICSDCVIQCMRIHVEQAAAKGSEERKQTAVENEIAEEVTS